MRRAVPWFALATVALAATAPLAIVRPIFEQGAGGPLPPGFTHVPGEVLTFSFQIEGYQASAQRRVDLATRVDAFDPQGVAITQPIESKIDAELTDEDKNWKPKVRHEIAIPPLAPSGAYKISVQVTDNVAHTKVSQDVRFEVRGHEVAPSPALVIRNFRFFRGEEDQEPLARAIYRPGDAVWARFDITGYKYAQGNRIDVGYDIAVRTAAGKVLWSQADVADEKSSAFYPQPYVPGSMSLNLQGNIRPGEYAIVVTAHDRVGSQTSEITQTFAVEQ